MADETQTNAQSIEQSTEQPTTSRKGRDIKAQLKELQEKNPERFQQLQAGTEADAERASQNPTLQAESKPEEVIPEKTFAASYSKMAGVDCYTAIFSFRDVKNYCEYASELYTDDEADELMAQWQRKHQSARVTSAKNYLLDNPVHFFPPLLLVCTSGAVINNTERSITCAPHTMGVLDGQHRFGGISEAVEANPALADESIPVVVLDLPDIEIRQQIFSDVNKTPKKVSKSLTISFDHSDKTARMVQFLMRIPSMNGGTAKAVAYITESGPRPKASDCAFMSNVNLYNMLRPDGKKPSKLVDRLTQDEIRKVFNAVIDNLPQAQGIKEGRIKFGEVAKMYVCYSGTLWQAIGHVLNELCDRPNADGSGFLHTPEQLVERVNQMFRRIRDTDGWSFNHARWNNPDEPVVVAGKVETKREYIERAAKSLRDIEASLN